jgi:hypothetical protein
MRTDGRTDKHDEAKSRFSHICVCAYKLTLGSVLLPTLPTTRNATYNTEYMPFIKQFIYVSFYPKVNFNCVSKYH